MRASSDGVRVSGSGITHETRYPIPTTMSPPRATCRKLIVCQRVRPVTRAPAKAMIAPPRGATTIAPMIDATESW